MGRIFARVLAETGFKRGRILDAGCGSGEAAIELARAFPQAFVVGVDLSEPLLAQAQAAVRKLDLFRRVSFRAEDVQALLFADSSFNVVVSVDRLHAVETPLAMLNELERVLAWQGTLLLGDVKRSWLTGLRPAFRTAFSLPEARKLWQESRLSRWRSRFVQAFGWFTLGVVKAPPLEADWKGLERL